MGNLGAMSDPVNRLSTEQLLEPHHRDVAGGPVRASVFGISDGLVTNVSLVLGMVGASPDAGFVRVAGLAGLVAGAFSMAAGEYVSMKAQTELLEFELRRERIELARRPEVEQAELAAIYQRRGLSPELASEVARQLMVDPEIALETHAREELGVDPSSLGAPVKAALSSFVAFCVGAVVPLAPWFLGSGVVASIWSISLSAVLALVIGFVLGTFSGRSRFRSAIRQLCLAAAAAAVTFAVGHVVGVGTS